MKLTIFGKTRLTSEGKPFVTYLTRLARKDKTLVTVQVKFRMGCQPPQSTPIIILVDRRECSMAEKVVHTEDGQELTGRTLWISAWEPSGEVYVDHSMDEYED